MNYSQQANPNPTNSEMDSKTIIKQPNLTSQQKEELIYQYVDILVDGMTMKDLISYVSQDMTDFLEKLTDKELEEEIVLTNEQELYDELVDNVTQQYPKQLNTFEKETFIDTNNTGGKY